MVDEIVPPEVIPPVAPPAEPPPPTEPPKQTAQERINEVYGKYKDAEREAEYWKNLAIEDDADPPPAPPPATPPPPAPPAADGRPVKAHFETPEQYEDALYSWRKESENVVSLAADKKQAMVDNLATFNKNAAEFRKEHADFDEMIEKPVFNDSMREVLLTIENGPALTYYIGKNSAVADRLRTLTPTQQIYEIGMLANQLKPEAATPVTTAPPPLDVIGDGVGIPEVDTSKMPIGEWMEWNKQQDLAKIKAGMGPL